MKLKMLFKGFAFIAITLLSSSVTANSLTSQGLKHPVVSQGLKYQTPALGGKNLRLKFTSAVDRATGRETNIDPTKALQIEKVAYIRGTDVASTNLAADFLRNPAQPADKSINRPEGVSLSANGCAGGGSSRDCFSTTASAPELKIYTMLVAGLGFLVFVAGRRREGLDV